MQLLSKFWYVWLEWPFGPIQDYAGIDLTTGLRPLAFKIGLVIVLFFVLFEVYIRLRRRLSRLFERDDDYYEAPEPSGPLATDSTFAESLEGAQHLEGTIRPLKKAKQYDRVAEVYASLNRHKEAAKWFGKARDRKRAAEEWAKAGYTLKAAKLLMKEGDYATAGRFFAEKGKHLRAAKAYQQLGDQPRAAEAFANAGKYDEAIQAFTAYFAETQEPFEKQAAAADACYRVLESEAGREEVSREDRLSLLPAVAARFEKGKRYALAAQLLEEAGQLVRAGEVYILAGKLQEAAKCMHKAGNAKRANQIAGIYYEKIEKWPEAGRAYASAGEYQRAGDCYGKANDAAHAAQCYENAGEYYGSALAYSHLSQYQDAIRLLQQLTESDENFEDSRALLGRCFYELEEYEHCAATLDNHLTGRRVNSRTIDYFYMLSRAYERLGKLEESREILYKIRSVNVKFKDVGQRLSKISSRISIGAQASSTPGAPQAGDPEATQIATVENLLGGRYDLDRELGRGGMGAVYLARDTQLDRPVALKFLGSLVDSSEEYRERFIREAKAAAKVSHPNIVNIYDISASMGKAYIAMEYVDGPSLRSYLNEKGRLTPKEAIGIVAQLCSALEAIHEAGLIHRDIKPENVLLAKGGLVKLTDFGLAKTEGVHITATNVVLGTPSYMAPEQTRGSNVDARTDIYATGLLLHETLTGQTVFSDGDILKRQQEETPPPPSALAEGIPPKLDEAIQKSIAKEPEGRFQTISVFMKALDEVEV